MIRTGITVMLASLVFISCAPRDNYPTEVPKDFEVALHQGFCGIPEEPQGLRISIYSNKLYGSNQGLFDASHNWLVLIWKRASNDYDKVLMVMSNIMEKDGLLHGDERYYVYVDGVWHDPKTMTKDEMKELEEIFPRANSEESALIKNCLEKFLNQDTPVLEEERRAI